MNKKKNRNIKLWLAIVIAALFFTMGTGFHRDLSADVEETYKGLKIFTDVIDMVEKNYVDPVDTKELIQNAIQGMVHSLDPHSARTRGLVGDYPTNPGASCQATLDARSQFA